MAQNVLPKTSIILYSITKEISKIYHLEREQWLSEVLQKHQGLNIFIHIHSFYDE